MPAGTTPSPRSMRASSSSASLFAVSAQRTGSSKNAICIMSRASLPLMGTGSALRASNTRASARRFSFADGGRQVLGRQLVARLGLHLFGEQRDLVLPSRDVLLALHLRHVHDVGLLVGAQDLVGLLLAVARGLAHVHIGHAEIGAGPAEMRAQRRLDQRADAAGQHLLAFGHPELRAAAQPRDGAAAGDDHLVGHEHAERAEHLAALLLQLDELGRAHAVDLGHHEVVERHVLGAVLLREVRVAERHRQHGAQLVVRLQIHAQVFPHCLIVSHEGPLRYQSIASLRCYSVVVAEMAVPRRRTRACACGTR